MRTELSRLLSGPVLTLVLLAACGSDESGPGKHRLVFTAAPTAGEWGEPFTVQPAVAVVDGDDVMVDSSTTEVALTIIAADSAALTGTAVGSVAGGVASFSGLAIDRPVASVRLVVSAPGLVPDTSAAFAIGGPGPERMVFTVVPDSGSGGEYLTALTTAEVRTADGRVVPWYRGVATLSLAGSVPQVASPFTNLDGKLVDTTEGGTVTFPSLNIDTAKVDYRLVVDVPGLLPDTSQPFEIHVGRMSIARSLFNVYGDSVKVGDSLQVVILARDLGGNLVKGLVAELDVNQIAGTGTAQFRHWDAIDPNGGTYYGYLVATGAGTPSRWQAKAYGYLGPRTGSIPIYP